MLDVVKLLNDKFLERLTEDYTREFGKKRPDYADTIVHNANRIINTIAESNTLYHNVEHTIQVTLVGQTVLRGCSLDGHQVTPEIWLNFIMALLCHDVGYVAGICASDRENRRSSDASDAVLMPVHIDRGKRYVKDTFADQPGIDVEFIQECIERTRFPVPDSEGYQRTDDYPGLVRGSDLVGQLSDPRYLKKLPAVFFEFEESGYNTVTGYRQPGDLIRNYAGFYALSVQPYVKETLKYLAKTAEGQQVIASLETNIAHASETSHRICD